MTFRNRQDVKRLTIEVRGVLNDVWDPIGVHWGGIRGPEDEYDCCVGRVVAMLRDGATDEEIDEYLVRQATEHMGLSRGRKQVETIAALRKFVVHRDE